MMSPLWNLNACFCCCFVQSFGLILSQADFSPHVHLLLRTVNFSLPSTLRSHKHFTFTGPCIVNVFKQTNNMQHYTMVFISINALHVSGGSSAHHQELKTLYTALGICRTFTASCRLRDWVGTGLRVLGTKDAKYLCVYQNVQTGCGAYPASSSMATGVLSWVQNYRNVKLITHLHLVPRLSISGAIPH